MTQQHTPVPWLLAKNAGKGQWCVIHEEDGGIWTLYVASFDGKTEGEAKANALFAVRACNNHDELLAAACFALKIIDAPDAPDEGASPIIVLARQMLRGAIAKATTSLQAQ